MRAIKRGLQERLSGGHFRLSIYHRYDGRDS
jgi:hypothetical protein